MNVGRILMSGFGRLTLDPSQRLRRIREQQEAESRAVSGWPGGPFGALPPLPDSAYPPGAVSLALTGGIPNPYGCGYSRYPASAYISHCREAHGGPDALIHSGRPTFAHPGSDCPCCLRDEADRIHEEGYRS